MYANKSMTSDWRLRTGIFTEIQQVQSLQNQSGGHLLGVVNTLL